MSFIQEYCDEHCDIAAMVAYAPGLPAMVDELVAVRARGGRLFLIGVGGSAANCSHAAADFRTLCDIQAYAFDNLANLTALTNDGGWDDVFYHWLNAENLTADDLVYVMSVGGGAPHFSHNLVRAMNYAECMHTPIIGVAGRDGGALAQHANACVIVPTVNPTHITPHTETMQALVWHLLVSHPRLKQQPTAWEGK